MLLRQEKVMDIYWYEIWKVSERQAVFSYYLYICYYCGYIAYDCV